MFKLEKENRGPETSVGASDLFCSCSSFFFSSKSFRWRLLCVVAVPLWGCVDYLPRSAHSLRRRRRSGVPGSGLPLRDSISRPMPNEAIPLALPEQGSSTLNTIETPTGQQHQPKRTKKNSKKNTKKKQNNQFQTPSSSNALPLDSVAKYHNENVVLQKYVERTTIIFT